MGGKRYSPEVKQQALQLAAGHTATAAARAIGADPVTVQRWVHQADAGTMSRYAAEKRAIASRNVLEATDAATKRVMDAVLHTEIATMKDVQAAATALGIMDDHYGMRPTQGTTGRFGTTAPLDQLEPGDRLIAERLILECRSESTEPPGVG